jgi:hypothetical protein
MRAADELTGPLGYSGWLAALAVTCVAVVLGVHALLAWRGLRADPRRVHVERPPAGLRDATLARIDAIGAEVAAGRLDRRSATTALSPLVRGFVGAVTGRPLASMTLADLEASRLPRVPELVGVLYPPQFAPESSVDTLDLVARAREVVATWS